MNDEEVVSGVLRLLGELEEHNDKRYGRWTNGLRRRVEEVKLQCWDYLKSGKESQVYTGGLRLKNIAEHHSQSHYSGGMTSGVCDECAWDWPCPTYLMATTGDPLGPWNEDDYDDDTDIDG